MNILEEAIEFEYKGHEFYKEKAALAKDPGVRNILENLAQDELDHATLLEQIRDGVLDNLTLSSSMTRVKDILKSAAMNDIDFLSNEVGLLEVLHAALQFEERARNHYQNEAVRQFDPKAQEILALLVKEEDKHYKLIAGLIKYLDSPKNILETQEFNFYDD